MILRRLLSAYVAQYSKYYNKIHCMILCIFCFTMSHVNWLACFQFYGSDIVETHNGGMSCHSLLMFECNSTPFIFILKTPFTFTHTHIYYFFSLWRGDSLCGDIIVLSIATTCLQIMKDLAEQSKMEPVSLLLKLNSLLTPRGSWQRTMLPTMRWACSKAFSEQLSSVHQSLHAGNT